MTDRRGTRASQVRPRPTTSGRAVAPRPRPRPSPYRIAPHRRLGTGRGIPFVARALLALAIVVLGGVVLVTATGKIVPFVAGIGSAVTHFLDTAGSSPSSVPSEGPVAGAPSLVAPLNPYTNEATVDITGTVPITILGSSDYTISLYQTLQGQQPALIERNVPIPQTATFTIPAVKLVKGSNVFTATIVGPGGESSPSRPVTYVLDQAKPKLTIISPKDGSTVNGTSVDIVGRTQGSSTILAQNANNHTSVTVNADTAGAFTITVAITQGANNITLTATDPASNATTVSLSLRRGTGSLSLTLRSNTYQFSAKKGATLRFTAVLTDPNGKPIVGTAITLTITLAGLPPDVRAGLTTDAKGQISVLYQINPGAAKTGVGKAGTVTASADTSFGHAQKTITITTDR